MKKEFRILLLGGTGKLGQKIIESGFFHNLFSPGRNLCDLKNKQSIDDLLLNFKPSHIINCAALARRKICENDIYTSSISILRLVDYIHRLLFSNYVGVINVGEKRESDYKKYRTYKPELIMSDLNSIKKESSLPFCSDYSLSTKRLDDFLGN